MSDDKDLGFGAALREMYPAGRIKFVCRTCGSDDVLADAFASWNADAQRWEVANVMDKGSFCNACEDERRIEQVPA